MECKHSSGVTQRLARIAGQVNGIRDMVEEGRPCDDLLVQLSSASSALTQVARLIMAEHPFQKRAFTQGLRDQHHRTQHAHGHRARHGGIGIYPRCAAHTHRPAGRGVSLLRRRAFHRPVPMERAGAPYRIMRKVPQRTYAHARQPHKAGQPRRRRKKDLSGAENGSFA